MLPSLSALEALDRIDRLGSVGAAAEALAVTPSAVSHRLRTLDAALGFAVVAPRGRGLALTPRARRYLDDARPALAALAAAGRRASGGERAGGPLRVAAAPGFASSWLCPRLNRFGAAHPGVALTLIAGEDERADVSIPFLIPGEAPPGALFLMQPDFFPVCAPALAHRSGGAATLAALGDQTLLHLGDRRDWEVWAETAGAPDDFIASAARDGREVILGDAILLLAAARAAQGVALGDAVTCSQALAQGALVRPLGPGAAAPAERAHYAVIAKGAAPAATLFLDWVRAMLAEGP